MGYMTGSSTNLMRGIVLISDEYYIYRLRRSTRELVIPRGDDPHVYMHARTLEKKFHSRKTWNNNTIREVCV